MSLGEAIALLSSVLASVVGNWATRWIADARKSRARIAITTIGALAVVIIIAHWHLGRAEEDRAWTATASSVSLAQYCDYVRKYPTGTHMQAGVQQVQERIGRIIDRYRARSSGHESEATVAMLTAVGNLCAPIVLIYSGEQEEDLPPSELCPASYTRAPWDDAYYCDNHYHDNHYRDNHYRDEEHEQALSSDLQAAFLRAFGEQVLQPQVAEATTGESSVIQLSVRYHESRSVRTKLEECVVVPDPFLELELAPYKVKLAPYKRFCWRPVGYSMDYVWHFGVRFPLGTQDRYSMDFTWSEELRPAPTPGQLDRVRRESFTAFGSWLARELRLSDVSGSGDTSTPLAESIPSGRWVAKFKFLVDQPSVLGRFADQSYDTVIFNDFAGTWKVTFRAGECVVDFRNGDPARISYCDVPGMRPPTIEFSCNTMEEDPDLSLIKSLRPGIHLPDIVDWPARKLRWCCTSKQDVSYETKTGRANGKIDLCTKAASVDATWPFSLDLYTGGSAPSLRESRLGLSKR